MDGERRDKRWKTTEGRDGDKKSKRWYFETTCTPQVVHTISKSILISFSDSPRYLEVRVEEETLKNVVPHSVATALARRVFPVPGGPTISTP